jgi:molybdopterin-containing oxidoreductase family membrane subunit
MILDRMGGKYAIFYICLISINVFFVQVLWIRRIRTSPGLLFIASVIVLTAMWLERFVIVVQSLHADFLPSAWAMYYPTFWDITQFLGTIGLFAFGMLMFIRFLPMISIFEIRELLPEAHVTLQEAD